MIPNTPTRIWVVTSWHEHERDDQPTLFVVDSLESAINLAGQMVPDATWEASRKTMRAHFADEDNVPQFLWHDGYGMHIRIEHESIIHATPTRWHALTLEIPTTPLRPGYTIWRWWRAHVTRAIIAAGITAAPALALLLLATDPHDESWWFAGMVGGMLGMVVLDNTRVCLVTQEAAGANSRADIYN